MNSRTVLAVALAMAGTGFAGAQAPTGAIHGHAQDPLGNPLAGASVHVSTDGKDTKYSFPVDANGDYKGDGIAPGTYILVLYSKDDKTIDEIPSAKITAGSDQVETFDLSRAEYIAKMTPEQRKAMEDVKAKNAEALKANSVIKNLNADLTTARADNKSKNYAEAEQLMLKDTSAKPDASVLWVTLGEAQAGQKKWPDATTSYQKAIDLEKASPKPNTEVIAAAYNSLGEALASQQKTDDAAKAYDEAAKVDPPKAGMYYSNETIVLSRSGGGDATAAAADKAIAADPTKPIPYYLKGQALIQKASIDPKTQKLVAPPGCAEAYQKYLELAPDGQFANDAKAILAEMGQTVKTSFKAKK
jgi:tetratricopeptide (TPR) repeat protein